MVTKPEEKIISPAQMRAARGLLHLSAEDLGAAVGMTRQQITKIENDHTAPRGATLQKIFRELTSRGIDFTANDGVSRRPPFMGLFEGIEGWRLFSDDRYHSALAGHTDFLSCGGVQDDFIKATGVDYFNMHTERMKGIAGFSMRALRPLSHNSPLSAGYIKYRLIADDLFPDSTFYVYGNKLALISHKPSTKIFVIEDAEISNSYRKQFEALWEAGRQVRDGSGGEE